MTENNLFDFIYIAHDGIVETSIIHIAYQSILQLTIINFI